MSASFWVCACVHCDVCVCACVCLCRNVLDVYYDCRDVDNIKCGLCILTLFLCLVAPKSAVDNYGPCYSFTYAWDSFSQIIMWVLKTLLALQRSGFSGGSVPPYPGALSRSTTSLTPGRTWSNQVILCHVYCIIMCRSIIFFVYTVPFLFFKGSPVKMSPIVTTWSYVLPEKTNINSLLLIHVHTPCKIPTVNTVHLFLFLQHRTWRRVAAGSRVATLKVDLPPRANHLYPLTTPSHKPLVSSKCRAQAKATR